MFLYIWLRCAKRFAIVTSAMITKFKAEKHKTENKYPIQWEGNLDYCNVVTYAETQEKLDTILSRSSRPRVPTEKLLVSVSDLTTSDDDEIPKRRKDISKSADVTRINKNLQNRLNNLANQKTKARDVVQPLTLLSDSPEEDSSLERATKKMKTCSNQKIISKKKSSNVVRDPETMFTSPLNDERSQQFPKKCTENFTRYSVRQPLRDVSNCSSISNTNLKIKQKRNSHAPHMSSAVEGTNGQKTKEKIHSGQSAKKNKEQMSTIIQDAHLTESNNDEQVENSTNARIKKYMKTIQYLNEEIGDLKKELEKKKREFGELKRNFEISQREEKRLKELNHELQQSCINSCYEFKVLLNQHKNIPCNSTEETRYLPSGFIRKDGSQIHLGRGIWIAKDTYYLAMSNITSNAMFVKNLAVAVFGSKVLTVSTLTGKGSNRNNQEKKPENQLDPRKVFAIKDFYRWWLLSKKDMDDLAADMESDRVKEYIRKKISDMKDGTGRKGRRKQKTSNVPNAADDINDNVFNLAQEQHVLSEMDFSELVCEAEIPEDVRNLAYELQATGETNIPIEISEEFSYTEMPDGGRSLVEEIHTPDEMEIPEEDHEDMNTELAAGERSLKQELYPPGEMEIPLEDREDTCETEIPDDVRSLAEELHAACEMEIPLECGGNYDVTYAIDNSASSSENAGKSLEGHNTGSISDDESCDESSEGKRGELAEAYNPNYNSFVDFEEEAYIPSSIVQKVHSAAYIDLE